MDWENRYQTGETPWDKATAAPELAYVLTEGHLLGRVLVPGCGRGHDARAIAATGASTVVGLDIAPSAVRGATELGRTSGLHFELGNLFALPAHWFGSFDWIWEHTCFCAIDPTDRERYVAAVHRLLKPHGSLLATFFIDPGLDPGEEGPPFGVSEAELDALFARHFVLEKKWAPRACFPGREGREQMRLLKRIH